MHPELSIHMVSQRILEVKGRRFLLDSDLAEIYEISTIRLNEQVKRNTERFPEDFRFRLTEDEYEQVKIVRNGVESTHGGRRYLPFGFTAQGATMVAAILNTPRAIQINILVVRAFYVETPRPSPATTDIRLQAVENQCTEILRILNSQPVIAFQPGPIKALNNRLESLNEILQKVAQFYSMDWRELQGNSRKPAVVLPRQVFMYLAKKVLSFSFVEIGTFLGNRDHTTIIHGVEKIEKKLKTDLEFQTVLKPLFKIDFGSSKPKGRK